MALLSDFVRGLLIFGGLLVFFLLAPFVFRLIELRTRLGWRRLGERLGLRVSTADLSRSLRGVIDGVDVDVVFQRRIDIAQTSLVRAGDQVYASQAGSGLAFSASPLEGGLDPHAEGPNLTRVRARGRLHVDAEHARWVPRGGARMGVRRLESSLRLFLAAVEEARVRAG